MDLESLAKSQKDREWYVNLIMIKMKKVSDLYKEDIENAKTVNEINFILKQITANFKAIDNNDYILKMALNRSFILKGM